MDRGEGERIAAELERLAEQVIQVANENIREVAGGVAKDLGPSETKVEIRVDTLKYDASVFALGALGTTVFLFVNTLVGGVLALAAPVLALVLRGRVATEVKAEAKEQGPLAIDRVATLIGPKLDEIIDGFGARLLEFVSQAGDALARGIADVLDQALRERKASDEKQAATVDVKQLDASIANLRAIDERIADIRQRVLGRLMGILDRITGTLEELTGDTDAAAAAEVTRAQGLADNGDLDGAEAALRAAAQQFPRYAPAFVAIGALDERRGNLEAAVTAYGRAVDIDGDRADSWYALGDALARLGRLEPARDTLRRALTLGIEPWFNARVYAALGRVHAGAGEWTAAARSLRKALDLLGPGEDDRGIALDYGRVLGRLGDRGATEWLTRAARAPDARGPVIVEAAAATVDHEKAEALLREGLERLPGDRSLRGGAGAAARPRGPHRRGDRARRGVRGGGAGRDRRTGRAARQLRRRRALERRPAGSGRRGPPWHTAAARRPRPPRPRRRRSRRPRRAGLRFRIPSPREAGRGLGRGAPLKPTRPCARHSRRSPPVTQARRRFCGWVASRLGRRRATSWCAARRHRRRRASWPGC